KVQRANSVAEMVIFSLSLNNSLANCIEYSNHRFGAYVTASKNWSRCLLPSHSSPCESTLTSNDLSIACTLNQMIVTQYPPRNMYVGSACDAVLGRNPILLSLTTIRCGWRNESTYIPALPSYFYALKSRYQCLLNCVYKWIVKTYISLR